MKFSIYVPLNRNDEFEIEAESQADAVDKMFAYIRGEEPVGVKLAFEHHGAEYIDRIDQWSIDEIE